MKRVLRGNQALPSWLRAGKGIPVQPLSHHLGMSGSREENRAEEGIPSVLYQKIRCDIKQTTH